MLFMFMCMHEDMKKIPARPLLIGYGLAGMGLMLLRIDSGVSGSPFLVLTQEKGGKRKSSPQPGAGKLAGYMIEMIVHPAFIFHFSFFTSPLAR